MELFASVLRLDRAACKALRIKDVYSLHRAVYSLFDDVRSEKEKNASMSSGIQWVDKGGNTLHRQVLILSNRKPKQTVDGIHGKVESKILPSSFLNHSMYRFEVMMNPVQRDNKTRKLIPIKGKEAIANWFINSAEKNWGFTVDTSKLQVENVSFLQFEAKHSITLVQAKLSGFFSVSDSIVFSQSVEKGIGRGRSFGCGLLQIVPVIESPLF